MAEYTANNAPVKNTVMFSPDIPALTQDLERLQTKLCLVEEYALLVQKRDNTACGLDGVALILGDLTSELGQIIDFMKGEVSHEES